MSFCRDAQIITLDPPCSSYITIVYNNIIGSTFVRQRSPLKEHVALDRFSWSLKSLCDCSVFVTKCILLERYFLKVEYNDPHKFALSLRCFPFTL